MWQGEEKGGKGAVKGREWPIERAWRGGVGAVGLDEVGEMGR